MQIVLLGDLLFYMNYSIMRLIEKLSNEKKEYCDGGYH